MLIFLLTDRFVYNITFVQIEKYSLLKLCKEINDATIKEILSFYNDRTDLVCIFNGCFLLIKEYQ